MERNWKESADFWRERSNAFELALRRIEALEKEVNSEWWKIAFDVLNASKKDV